MVRATALGLRGANLVWCSRHSTSRVAAVAAAHPNRRASVAISSKVGPAHPGAETKTSSSPNSGTDTRTGLSDRGRRSPLFLRCFCWARCCAPGNDELLEACRLSGSVGWLCWCVGWWCWVWWGWLGLVGWVFGSVDGGGGVIWGRRAGFWEF